MNKLIFSLYIVCFFSIHADSYDEAMKFEAKGDLSSYRISLDKYFNLYINDINQDSIIEKLIYSSTLLESIDETLDFLNYYVRFMENSESRFRIYKKIAEFFELKGSIKEAGIYYEKAAYVNNDLIEYETLLNSIDMLIELGYFELSIKKLIEIEFKIDKVFKDRLYIMISRAFKLIGDREQAIRYLSYVNKEDILYKYIASDLYEKNLYDSGISLNSKIVDNRLLKLKNPTDLIGEISEIDKIPNIPKKKYYEHEQYLGRFKNKEDAAGIINIIEQMSISWFFDKNNEDWDLYIFPEDRDSFTKLESLGIVIKEK